MIISSKKVRLEEEHKKLKESYFNEEIRDKLIVIEREINNLRKYKEDHITYYDTSYKGKIRTGKNIFKEG